MWLHTNVLYIYSNERYHSRWRFWNTIVPHHQKRFKTVDSHLQQTDDLLSIVGFDAC